MEWCQFEMSDMNIVPLKLAVNTLKIILS